MNCDGGVVTVICGQDTHLVGVGERELALLGHGTSPDLDSNCCQVASLVDAVTTRWPRLRFSLLSVTAAAADLLPSWRMADDAAFEVMVGAARRELPSEVVDMWLNRGLPLPDVHEWSEFFGVPPTDGSLSAKVDSWINDPLPGAEALLSRVSF